MAVSQNATFTPMLTNSNPELSTFYYIGLEGISVGGHRVQIQESVLELQANGSGGVLIDSGTAVTRLAKPVYKATRNAFRNASSNLKLLSKGISLFDTCFDLSGMTTVSVPTVKLHFTNLDVSLPANNYLIPVDDAGTFCFAFAAAEDFSIIGNIQQQGFRVVYDLEAELVGFAPDSC
ncbi:Aspartyl protease protein 2 [Orobanche gracilis]